MFSSCNARRTAAILAIHFGIYAASPALAVVARFNSNLGAINVRLYQTLTPLTTNNFTQYVNAGRWVDTFIHRSAKTQIGVDQNNQPIYQPFVIQGGGYTWANDTVGVGSVAAFPAVQNEFHASNLRGTIAMAKLGGDPNSATSQWFFNLADNSSNLDNQNGGFTAFGRVLGTGMTVVDAIAATPVYNAGSPFDTLPLVNYTGGNVTKSNFVLFSTIDLLNIPAADYDLNNAVNAADLTQWKSTFGSTTDVLADGNGSAQVDGSDFLLWQRGFPHATATVGAVPEPQSLALAAAAILLARTLRLRR